MPEPQENYFEEVVQLDSNTPDEDIINLVKKSVAYFSKDQKKLEEVQKKSIKYWRGDQLDKALLAGKTAAPDNRIFVSTETIVPIVTAETPIPTVVTLGERDEELEKKLSRFLQAKYELQDMNGAAVRTILERITRHLLMGRYGVAKVIYNREIEKKQKATQYK